MPPTLDRYARPPLPAPLRAQLRDAFATLPPRAFACQVLFLDLCSHRVTQMLAARDADGRFTVVGPPRPYIGPAPTRWFAIGQVWVAPKER